MTTDLHLLIGGLVAASSFATAAAQSCIDDKAIEDVLADANGIPAGSTLPLDGSCCQLDMCGLPCPVSVEPPTEGFAIAIAVFVGISFVIGLSTYFVVAGKAENFFVAGRSLPVWIAAFTLGAQSIDANALLGNADLSYKYHFWDGAVLPIGLGLSLILNSVFLAHKVNEAQVLTLPDIFARYYGPTVEVLVSICTIISFLCLLAGNLFGLAVIVTYIFDIDEKVAVYVSSAVVWAYTVSGGLFSVAYTDVVQGAIGWTGCLACSLYLITQSAINAPPPSRGFPGYVYPDLAGDGGACDLYDGVPCNTNATLCCYNEAIGEADNGAYPFGDQRIFADQMTNPNSLTPFPNAIGWNWATIIILAFGNLAALDFQARCMATKTPSGARLACLIGGLATFLIGIPFAYTGAITRFHYGPDSIHAEFEADSCSEILGLPTCGLWLPDPIAFIKLLTHEAPPILGAWCLCGIVAASMSTADGAILAMGTVFAHNIMRQTDRVNPGFINDSNLLTVSRISTLPFTVIAALIAAFYRSNHSAGGTGYLLIVAFDVVLATVVAPLFGAFYNKKPSPRAAFMSILCGGVARVVMEFVLPKDGFLLLPFGGDEFLNYGTAASANFPVFFDEPSDLLWDPSVEQCNQPRYEDYTGVDSLGAFLLSIVVFIIFQGIEDMNGVAAFSFPGQTPYEKFDTDAETADKSTATFPATPTEFAPSMHPEQKMASLMYVETEKGEKNVNAHVNASVIEELKSHKIPRQDDFSAETMSL